MRTDTQAEYRAEAQARVQARLRAAAETLAAANQSFQQTRPGQLVQQYRTSEFHGRTKHAVRVRFRLHADGDPAPASRRLALVAGWAATLGMAGVLVALPVLIGLFRPGGTWYTLLMMLIGAVGIGATGGAFASIHRRRAPWIGLCVGTVCLAAAIALTAAR
jgi:hypothetical protein